MGTAILKLDFEQRTFQERIYDSNLISFCGWMAERGSVVLAKGEKLLGATRDRKLW